MAETSAHRGMPDEVNRDAIINSWRRAEMYGVDPERPTGISVEEVDGSSRLMEAATPVFDRIHEELRDESVCLIIADRHCRIVRHWTGDLSLKRALESRGVGIGMTLDEGSAGTNGLGTALETGQGVRIDGTEHYLHTLKVFSCYGHPIRHPLTRRIEGVLDITVDGAVSNPLFRPLLMRAAQDIEANILDSARESDRKLFHAFQSATRKRSAPVAALSEDVVLTNRSCMDALGSAGPSVLRILLEDVLRRGSLTHTLDLGAAGRVHVEAERVEGTRDGALFHIGAREPDLADPGHLTGPIEVGADLEPVLVAGEPGSGRSTTAAFLTRGGGAVATLQSCDVLTGSERSWATQLVDLARQHKGVLVIEDVHVLPERLCAVIRRVMDSRGPARLVLTSCPVAELPIPATRLAARCGQWLELPPLRERLHELPALAARMGAYRRPDRDLVFTSRSLEALSAYPWPGNLGELARLVDELSARPWTGRIDVAELPKRYRASSKATGLGGREQAERNAILNALACAKGNKLRAADQLGISRTTLYRRMRALGVDEGVLSSPAEAFGDAQ